MKYCSHCGNEIMDDTYICPNCGCKINSEEESNSGLKTAAKIFMIIGCIINSIYLFLIPLLWCIPMTVSYFKKTKNNEEISTGFKVCTLFFVNIVAGILMLCDNKD